MSLLRNWHKKTKEIKPIPPKFVKTCNLMDHVEVGEKADLLKFSTPRFHELDGGRYFGTCHAVIQFPHQSRYAIVVEEDIDPSDIEQVIWAMTTRGQPHEAVQVLHHCRSNGADTTIPLQEKVKYKVAPKPLHNSRIVIDACWSLEWQKDWYPLASLSPELGEELLKKWGNPLSEIVKKQIR
jgi:3-polyprenyl-4-hydroxybenzoate decarboxylase